MRLSEKTIKFVKVLMKDDIRYEWFVALKGGETRCYNIYENGKTVADYDIGVWQLPKSVEKFVTARKAELYTSSEDKGNTFSTYIYR